MDVGVVVVFDEGGWGGSVHVLSNDSRWWCLKRWEHVSRADQLQDVFLRERCMCMVPKNGPGDC